MVHTGLLLSWEAVSGVSQNVLSGKDLIQHFQELIRDGCSQCRQELYKLYKCLCPCVLVCHESSWATVSIDLFLWSSFLPQNFL